MKIFLALFLVSCGADKIPFVKKEKPRKPVVSTDACTDAAIVASTAKAIAKHAAEIVIQVSNAKAVLDRDPELADAIDDAAREADRRLAKLNAAVVVNELRESDCIKPKDLSLAERVKKEVSRWSKKVKEILKDAKEKVKEKIK